MSPYGWPRRYRGIADEYGELLGVSVGAANATGEVPASKCEGRQVTLPASVVLDWLS